MKNRDASSRRQIIVSIVGWQRLAARKLSRAIVQKDSSEKFPHTNESGHKAGLGEKEGSGSGLFTKCISCALHHFCCSVPGWDCVVLQFIQLIVSTKCTRTHTHIDNLSVGHGKSQRFLGVYGCALHKRMINRLVWRFVLFVALSIESIIVCGEIWWQQNIYIFNPLKTTLLQPYFHRDLMCPSDDKPLSMLPNVCVLLLLLLQRNTHTPWNGRNEMSIRG